MKKIITQIIAPLAVVSFILNLIWENAQAPLYAGYAGFVEHFPICLNATLGDVAMNLIVYAIIALIFRNPYWIETMSWKSLLLAIALGTLLGAGVEQFLIAIHRWSYAPNMPILPIINLGFTPLVQMALLPAVAFCLISFYGKHVIRYTIKV